MQIFNRNRIRSIALLWMFLGTGIILFFLAAVNNFKETTKTQSTVYAANFEVKQQKKSKPKRKQVQKRTRTQPKAIATPLLDIEGDIAGLDLGLPAFSLDKLAGKSDLLGDTRNIVLTSDLVDKSARVLSRVPVEYPRRARAKEIEGYVTISLLIDKTGHVKTAKVIDSEPAGIFEEKALQTVKSWLFEPAEYKGDVVKSWVNQTIRFELG